MGEDVSDEERMVLLYGIVAEVPKEKEFIKRQDGYHLARLNSDRPVGSGDPHHDAAFAACVSMWWCCKDDTGDGEAREYSLEQSELWSDIYMSAMASS